MTHELGLLLFIKVIVMIVIWYVFFSDTHADIDVVSKFF